MKLLSCHILNFGKLSDKVFEFENLTVIKEDNSFGKTTLADFIISMFYNLPDLKVRDLTNERRKYQPWQSNMFGGSIIFEYKDKKYELERDFNKNSFKICDITSIIKKQVLYIDEKEVDANNIGEIIFGISKESFKKSAYLPQSEVAYSALESGLNDKLRSLINDTTNNHSLEKSLNILQKAAETLETKRGKGRINELDSKIKELSLNIENCKNSQLNLQAHNEKLKILTKNLQELEEKISELDIKIIAQSQAHAHIAEQKLYIEIKENILQNQRKIENLSIFFNNNNANSVNLQDIKDKIDSYKMHQQNLKKLEEETFIERSKLYNIEDARIAKLERKKTIYLQIEEFDRKKQQLLKEKDKVSTEIKTLEKMLKKYKSFVYKILCLMTLGIYCLFIKSKKGKILKRVFDFKNQDTYFDEKIAELEKYIAKLLNSVEEIETKNDGSLSRLKELEEQIKEKKERVNAQKTQLQLEFEKFNCASYDFTEGYFEIKEKLDAIKQAQSDLKESSEKLSGFLKDKDEYSLMTNLENFSNIDELNTTRKNLDEKRISCVKEILELESLIIKEEQIFEEIFGYQAELENFVEQKSTLLYELEALKLAAQLLKQADDNLANKYLLPLIEKVRGLISEYDSQKNLITLNSNLQLFVKENGSDRDINYYSTGIKEIVSICMRIALTQTIYARSDFKPFIILDDPFVNLDDTKIIKAKEFIKNLSKAYQIIYLTCHNSRKIE